MKKILFLAVVLIGCKQPPKEKPLYFLETKVDGTTNLDTIQAVNDTAAYQDALLTIYSASKAKKLIEGKDSWHHSFALTDAKGNDLQTKLPKTVLDSLERNVRDAFNKMNLK